MSDVFISYAHTTARQAQAAAAALRAAGYSVWLDDDLDVHRAFTQAIEEQLTAAKAALVIWSADAAKSQWVLSEANRAREDGKLVQLAIDRTRLPMPFDQVQCADLSDWTGEAEHPNWRRVTASIATLVGGDPATAPSLTATSAATPTAEPLLAVLAFDNLSGDPEMAWFSDGVSDEIQQTVARGTSLKVVGRASSFHYRGADKAAQRIAGALGATHVLDGSVRRAGQRVRISAQLIECEGAVTLWSDRFDGELTDVFELQDGIAAAVAKALRVVFAPASPSAPIDPAAHEAYLKGRQLYATRLDKAGLDSAIALMSEAVRLAPGYARACVVLAGARILRFRQHGAEGAYTPMRAELLAAADSALALDPNAGALYLNRAMLEAPRVQSRYEPILEKALALSPNDSATLALASSFPARVGHFAAAVALADRAVALDPVEPIANTMRGLWLGAQGATSEATLWWERAMDLFPDSPLFVSNAMSSAAIPARDWERVEALARRAERRSFYSSELRSVVGYANALRTGDPQFGEDLLAFAYAELARTGTVREILFAWLCQLGRNDDAFALIEAASFEFVTEARQPWYGLTTVPSIFSPLQSGALIADARYPRLCARLGLADYWVESGRWPDFADQDVTPYDFKAACRRLAASATTR